MIICDKCKTDVDVKTYMIGEINPINYIMKGATIRFDLCSVCFEKIKKFWS